MLLRPVFKLHPQDTIQAYNCDTHLLLLCGVGYIADLTMHLLYNGEPCAWDTGRGGPASAGGEAQ